MLLYIIESAVPLLTILLLWAAYNALKKNIPAHKKAATIHAIATWISTALVFVLVRLGFGMGDNAPAWIREIHFFIIYQIPPLLGLLMYLGLNGKRKIHMAIAAYYALVWIGGLVTGLMIFLMHKGWM